MDPFFHGLPPMPAGAEARRVSLPAISAPSALGVPSLARPPFGCPGRWGFAAISTDSLCEGFRPMILNNIKNYDTDEEKSTQKPRREG
jgi:hypothetical protein